MDNINFKKVLDDGELFDQQVNYEDNFEKINQEVVPKITDLETNKVDKETGKGLSTNDFDNTYKQKIDTDIPAQLNEIEQDKAEKADVGLLSGLLTTAKTSIVNAINELFNSKANKAQENWITPTLLNGWKANVVPTLPPKYYKDTLGIVHLKGVTENGVSAGAAFVLPVGYRSSGTLRFACASRAGISSVFTVDIKNNGEVVIIRDTTLDRWVDLSSISFRAEG